MIDRIGRCQQLVQDLEFALEKCFKFRIAALKMSIMVCQIYERGSHRLLQIKLYHFVFMWVTLIALSDDKVRQWCRGNC